MSVPADASQTSHWDTERTVIRDGRVPVRIGVRDALTRAIVSGAIASEQVVSIAAASRHLGVSATPVREALVELQHRGLVDVQPGRGFTVRPLDASELGELYETLSAMEIAAVSLSAPFALDRLERLSQINRRFRATRTAGSALELDAEWHEVLVSGCDNRVLQEQMRCLRLRARRYERHYMADDARVERSAQQHGTIVNALRDGRLHDALTSLQDNWISNIADAMPELQCRVRVRETLRGRSS